MHHRLSMLSLALALAAPSSAQDLTPERRPGDERIELPPFETPAPAPVFELPPPPQPEPDAGRPPSTAQFVVRDFVVTGSTVFSKEQMDVLAAPYENRPITLDELLRLRDEITRLYISAGYQNSGAVIPEQPRADLESGVVRIQIVEGTLSRIDIQKTGWFRESYFRNRLEAVAKQPLDVNTLQERLQLFQQDPRIRRVEAALHPGDRPGDAVLEASFEEERPYRIEVQTDNYENPSIGSNAIRFGLFDDNLLGIGDEISAEASFSEGLDDYEFTYAVPVNRYDTTLGASYSWSKSDVVEEPFDPLDISSRYQAVGLALEQPLLRDLNTTVSVLLSAEWRESETFLLGEPFSFTEGPEDGKAKESVVRLGMDWVYRDLVQVVAARSVVSVGLDILDATAHGGDVPDGQFVTWLGQFQWLRRFELWDVQVLFRTDVQLASSPLLSMEQFAIGGHASVRGYRENQLVRDNGLVSSLEVRIPLWASSSGDFALQLAPFADIGQSWNTDRGEVGKKTLSSVGIGLRCQLTRYLEGQIYWGEALRDIPEPDDHDLQDEGVQFRVAVTY